MAEQRQGKLQFRIDLILTGLFLAGIFFMLFATIAWTSGLWGHLTYFSYVSEYLDDPYDYTAWELIEAAKNSLDGYIAENIYGTDALGKVNSAFQYALGKKLVSTGGTQMIRLNTGHLYDLQSEMALDGAEADILRMREVVPEGTPFVFVYEHSTLYDPETQMPAGYGFLDYNTANADELLRRLREDGVDVIDSRDVYRDSGLSLEEFLLYTDKHWSTRAAITVAQAIAERIEERTGTDIDTARLDIEQFDTEVYPKLFMGQYAVRLAERLVDLDDITTYAPKYDTDIRRYTLKRGEVTDLQGTFEEVNLRRDALVPQAGKSWNTNAYHAYGLVESYDILTNEAGADCTILLLKDSFSAPVGRFLSLVANEVYSVDLRERTITLQQWLDRCNPDIVVLAYSMQMLRSEHYAYE